VFIQQCAYYREVALPAARAFFASRGWTYFPEVPEKAPEPEEAQLPMVICTHVYTICIRVNHDDLMSK
jgi:hypothetical protein